MRKCIRCGEEMIDGLVDYYGCVSFKPLSKHFVVKAAICPNCKEVSYYMEDKTFEHFEKQLIKEEEIQKRKVNK